MDVGRNEDGTIAKGFSLNPKGRPKGGVGGRCRALGLLDSILSEAECEKSLEKALREALQRLQAYPWPMPMAGCAPDPNEQLRPTKA